MSQTYDVDLNQLATDIALLNNFVHGAEDETVRLGEVDTPTLRNLVSNITTNVTALLARVTAYEDRMQRMESALSVAGIQVQDGDDVYSVQILGGLSPMGQE